MEQEIYGWLVDHLGANTAGVLAVLFFVISFGVYLRMRIGPIQKTKAINTKMARSNEIKVPLELQTPISYLEGRK
jgi:hypothetical protein